MKKHRVSEKSTSKTFRKRLRILACILCVCVLFATYSDLLMTFSVLAADTSEEAKVQYVSAFAELSREVREQTVPVGTELEALLLPDTLEAVLWQPEGGLLSEDTSENEETSVNEHENTETADTMPTAQEPADTEQNSSDTAIGANGTDDAAQTDAENVQDAEQNMDTKSVQDTADIEQAADESAETAPLEQQENTEMIRKTHVVAMTEYNAEHVIDVQTLTPADTQNAQQQEQTVRISGITWQSVPAYDKHTRGGYIFTAVLPEGFLLAEGVSLPQITVTVENDGIRALHDRIAALPDAEKYLAQEPDTEEMQAYAQWEETLRAHAREALAIWEEYAALTEEQKAQITEEELAKLTAWAELAERFSDHAVMLADVSEHHAGWTALSSSDTELAGGNYYLAGPVSMGTITIKGDVTLCLNGQTLTHSGDTGSVIVVESGTFTLCDCENDTGCITGGKGELDGSSLYGGGIYVCKGARLIMRGGIIRGNTAKYGGGISIGVGNNNAGTYFTMSGGVIEDNTADSQGGGIFCGGIGEMTITNGVIRNNTANSRGAGIFAGTAATVNLLANGETDKVSICGNKVVESNGNGGGYTDFQKAILKIEGNVNITGNKRDQDENNIALLNGRVILLTKKLTGSFGVTTWYAPYSENNTDVNNPYKTTVQGADGYEVSSSDLARISSDDTRYSVLMIEGNIVDAANGETGKVLVLGNKDTGNLSGMDLSIKDGSSGEEIKLSPDFAETTYEYTVTVPNSVRAVSIVATPKNAGAAVAMTIQNADNVTDTTVAADNIPLAEGKNTIKVNVTEGGASKVYIIIIIREASAGNTVTVTTRKDGAEWAKPSTDYRLTNDNGATFITDLSAVPDGTYRIYDGDNDTNVDVTVNGKAVTAYVDYYTVTFYDGSTKLTDPAQQTVRKGDAASKPADGSNPAKTGYTFTAWVTADGGSTAYDFAVAVMEKTAVYAGWTDDIAPVLGTLQYSYAPKRLLQWLIGKEDLTITVPVTEEGSGADEITCTITPTGAAVRKETSAIQNGKAQMTVSKDFKGTIAITCTDKAGNTSKDVTVDVLLEDHAPQIAVEADHAELLPTGEYRTAPSLTVTVTDNKDNVISSGIASVRYQLGSGSEQTIDGGYTKAIVETDRFTIASDEIPAGETLLTITATDHAGNSVTVRQTIKVHAHSGTLVAATEATCTEDGMKAHYTCACGTWFWDSGCTQEIAEQSDVVIGALGHAFGKEYLFDETDHWRQCARCKELEPKENHIFDNDADMTCNKCDYERATGEHVHKGMFVPAKTAGCTTAGNKAYYVCKCGNGSRTAVVRCK